MTPSQVQDYLSIRCCPRCGSGRLQRSRRRKLLDRMLSALGGELRRCQACCARRIWFGMMSVPVAKSNGWSSVVAMAATAIGAVIVIALRSV